MEDAHDIELDPSPAEAEGNDEDGDERFERPVDRFRASAVGTVVAAGLLGLAEALEARPPREETAIVQDVPMHPPLEPRRLELLLDPEHPERSMVFLPEPADGRERPPEPT